MNKTVAYRISDTLSDDVCYTSSKPKGDKGLLKVILNHFDIKEVDAKEFISSGCYEIKKIVIHDID